MIKIDKFEHHLDKIYYSTADQLQSGLVCYMAGSANHCQTFFYYLN